jgi:uncharacterized protein YndB with AHSA1/START domain
MIYLKMATLIYQPLAQVFDFLTTSENDPQWQYGTFAAPRLSIGVVDTGTIFRSIAHLVGRRNIGVFEVTEYELNKKFGFKSIAGPLYLWSTYTFAAFEAGTRVTSSTRVHVGNFFRLEEARLEYMIQKQLKENLRKLKDLLEEIVFSMEAYPLVGAVGLSQGDTYG